ncbi:MAG: tetratricopeptide repeat protein [Ignavibacteria bacterium]|nr:tetratricopeptide repeat protein [Ignavibacteria bacterium]
MNQRPFHEISDGVLQARDVRDADAMLQHAAELEELGTAEGRALAARTRGSVYLLRDRNTTKALEQFENALELYRGLNDPAGMAKSHRNVAEVYEQLGQFSDALEHFYQALNLYEETGNHYGAARTRRFLGTVLKATGNWVEAFSLFHQALATYNTLGSTRDIALTLNVLGIVLKNSGQYPEALEHFYRSLSLFEELGDHDGVALVTDNIGSVYYMIEDYQLAIEFRERSLRHYESVGDERSVSSILSNIGNVYVVKNDFDRALEYYRRASAITMRTGTQRDVARTTGLILGVLVRKGPSDEADQLLASLDAMSIPDVNTRLYMESSRALLQEQRGMYDESRKTLLSSLMVAQECALPFDEVGIHGQLRDLALKQNDLAAYVEHNNAYQRINEEINGKATTTTLAMQEAERKMAKERQAHEKHLAILHSTLPQHIAERVARGEVVNDHYDNASVIFLDIVGFTDLSSSMKSQDVITLLDNIFTQCDAICEQYNVTKIKTIGDSYMAVAFETANTEQRTANSVVRAANAAIEMMNVTLNEELTKALEKALNKPIIEFRIGIHCGPVTAGVIGTQRMQYDVWGDTVNVASRLESTSLPGQIQTSEAFAAILSATSLGDSVERPVQVVERGTFEIKGKGMMKTYWLE